MKSSSRTRKSRLPVNQAPPRAELHSQLAIVPDDVSGPSDGKSRKRPRLPDDEPPPPTRLRLEPQLDLVPDDLPEDRRRQLDEATLATLRDITGNGSGFEGPFPNHFTLLSAILGNSGYPVNPRYKDVTQLPHFLAENPAVRDMLEEAWNDRTFKQIRNLGVFLIGLDAFHLMTPKTAVFRQVPQSTTVFRQKFEPVPVEPARRECLLHFSCSFLIGSLVSSGWYGARHPSIA
jgi:hypothetical protein